MVQYSVFKGKTEYVYEVLIVLIDSYVIAVVT